MKMIGLTLLCVLPAYQLVAGVSPVQKVLQMMEEMKRKASAEKEEEMKIFEKYEDWCKDVSTDKNHEIITSTDAIGRSESAIEKHSAAEVKLTDEIAATNADIAQWQGDHKAATEVRETEKADYDKTHTDYGESIDALDRAIIAIKKSQNNVPQAMMLLQKMAMHSRIPESGKSIIATLLESEEDDEQRPSAPQAAAYAPQSGGVIKMLEDLKEKFNEEQSALMKSEMEAKNKFDLLALSLTDQIKVATKEGKEKAGAKADCDQSAAEAQTSLDATTAAKAEDEKYLAELNARCELKADAFEARQKMRAEEIEALAKAIEIIGGKSVSGAADKHLPSLVTRKVHVSMAQLRAKATSGVQARAAELLSARAETLKSHDLLQLSARVAADPMAKVIRMIEEMIQKLTDEANAEAEHKGWCDEELKQNKLTRDEKTEGVNMLTSSVDQLGATIDKLTGNINDNQAEVVELDNAVVEATEIRSQEKAKNLAAIADAKAAIEAVTMAMNVLKEFYGKAAEAKSFVQGPEDDEPAFATEPYKGNQGGKGGIIGMMEVISTDFARVEADTTADEAQSAKDHKEFLDESSTNKALKEKDSLDKSRERTAKEGELGRTQTDLMDTQKELSAAQEYFDVLKPDCIEEGLSFEERTQQREAEIESLKEAYKILDSDLA